MNEFGQRENKRKVTHTMLTRTKVALVGAALVLAACGGDGAPAGGAADNTTTVPSEATTVNLGATEFSFEPATITLDAGATVEVVLENVGVVEHDFTLDEGDVLIHANAAETSRGTFTAPAAGTYTFFCSVPGHREAGMEGTLIVEGA